MTTQENQQPLAPDTQLQYFKILKYLARGGFGITYLALDTKRNRPVVIKEYFPSVSAFRNGQDSTVSLLSTNHSNDYQEGLRRFQREAVTLSEFKHPNIVEVIAFFEANNTAYFVMEFIEGESLQDKLDAKNGKPFTEAEIQRDFLPILKGLKKIHSIKLLHLDIKPENILQTKYGEPLLIDFGGARFATGQASHDHSSMVATAGYAPPEQYSLSQEQTPASDIYAFGMTLYKLMAPKEALPDSKDRQNALLEEIPDPLKPIREVAKGYSETLYKLVEQCTKIKKSARPESVSSIEQIMDGYVFAKNDSDAESITNPEPESHSNQMQFGRVLENPSDRTQTQGSKKPWLLIAGLISTIAVGGVWYQQEQEKQREQKARLVAIAEQKEQELNAIKAERLAREKAEAERLAREKAEADRLAREKAETERLAREKAEADRLVREKAEADRLAREKAEETARLTALAGTKDYSEDFKKTLKAAEQGDAGAQLGLGFMYYKGKGVKQDYAKAFEWFQKAADQDYAVAQNNLGTMYYDGKGVKQDYAKAFEWFQKSADQGLVNAQKWLGVLYANGEGVKQDYAKAVHWYQKAADQGHAGAQYNLGFLYKNGEGVKQDYAKAVYWYQKAADQGDAYAQTGLGQMYFKGEGVKQDYAKALEWIQKAADQGYSTAQSDLGFLYQFGKGVKQDYSKALEWYQKAADQGHEAAKDRLKELNEVK